MLTEQISSNITGIEFKFVSSAQLYEHSLAISDRLSTGKTIPGTQSHHKFVPTSDGLKMFRLSADTFSTTIPRMRATTETPNSDQDDMQQRYMYM